jgi:hypothetical protein
VFEQLGIRQHTGSCGSRHGLAWQQHPQFEYEFEFVLVFDELQQGQLEQGVEFDVGQYWSHVPGALER